MGRQHRDFRAERYLIGVGQGATAAQAEAAARTELLGEVRRAVKAEFDIRLPKLTIDGVAWIRAEAVDSLSAEPAGMQVPVRWQSSDGLRNAALAVIPRQELLSAALEQIGSDEDQCRQLAEEAGRKLGQAPYPALLNLLAALSLRAQVEEQRAFLAALGGTNAPPASRGPALTDLLAVLQPTLAAIRLTPARGHGLPVRADARQVVLVLAADLPSEPPVPLAHLPIRFFVPGSDTPSQTRVNPAGMAEIELPSVRPFAGQTIQIEARVDAATVLGEAGLDAADPRFAPIAERLLAPKAVFDLRVLATSAGRVAIIIAETRDGEFHENSRLVADLVASLTGSGLQAMTLDELDVELPTQPTPKTMAAALAGKADFLIYGVVQAKVTRTLGAGMSFAEAKGQLIGVRVRDGAALIKTEPLGRGPGRDTTSAINRAISAFGRQALATILPALTASATDTP